MITPDIPKIFVFAVFAYLLGSIPSGYWITRVVLLKDIRQLGSGNIGATNVARIAGIKLGLTTLFIDIAKGAVPVLAAQFYFKHPSGLYDISLFATALSAVLGHLFPWSLGFKGGKGVAIAAGCFLVISPMGCLVSVAVFLLCVVITHRVSVGSMSGALALPLGIWWAGGSAVINLLAAITAALVVLKHAKNIRRLLAGTETKFR